MSKTAQHRPAKRVRRFRHDDLVAVDLFSGFGGLTQGIERAGFTTIMAANHNEYKIRVHEANHPHAEHWIADLVDKERMPGSLWNFGGGLRVIDSQTVTASITHYVTIHPGPPPPEVPRQTGQPPISVTYPLCEMEASTWPAA
jgi:hypothetical protein